MSTPDFVVALREHIGHAPLNLVGVTAIVFRDEKVLLGKRADNGAWQAISGIVEPGEEPADTAVRESLEEAGVTVKVERLALVQQLPPASPTPTATRSTISTWCSAARGSRASRTRPTGELTEIGFYDLAAMGDVDDDHVRRIALAVAEDDPAHFRGGRPPKS